MISWKLRYAALIERHAELSDPERRILEIGCAGGGLARYLQRHVVAVESVLNGGDQHLQSVCASILNLPFGNGAFDDVVCFDALQQLAAHERQRAVSELIRVSRRQVIVGGPAGAYAQWSDTAYAAHLRSMRDAVPPWLEERLRHGNLSLGDMLQNLLTSGHPFEIHALEGVIQHYSALLANDCPFMARFFSLQHRKSPFEAPLSRAESDVPYSYLFTIDTTRRMARSEPTASSKHAESAERGRHPAEIFAVGHRLDRMPDLPEIRRILAGSNGEEPSPDAGMLRDDVGQNIAASNPRFSELTAIYWVWKNLPHLSGVGFCHYRRYFDFRNSRPESARQTNLRSPDEVASHRSYFTDPDVIARTLEDGAIVVARKLDAEMSIAEQYMRAHIPDHYLAMVNDVLARYPHLARHVVAQFSDTELYCNNMFVMHWADFDQLCRFWFDCLFRLDQRIATKPGDYQGRTLAFLSERLFDIHLRWLRHSGRRIVEYPLFFLEDSAFSRTA